MSYIARPYQAACEAAIHDAFESHQGVMVELATGLGKTEIFTAIASGWQDGRTLVVAPFITLVSQAAKKICQRTGIMPGIEQGQQWSNESEWARSPFVVASKQTLCKKRRYGERRYERFQEVGLVIVDECHYSATEEYVDMLRYFKDRGAKVLGLTATARRHDKRAMALNFETCAFQYGIVDAVPDGWLVPARVHCVQLEKLDLSQVGTKAGDFVKSELNAALEDDKVLYEIAHVTAQESGKKKTAVFCSSVAEARGVANILIANYGMKASWICADQRLCTEQRRKEVLDSFTEDPDGIQVVCNVGILTVGWDFPGLEHIVMARPTQSLPLYTQIFGRGTRPLPGVVDFADSTAELRRQRIGESRKPFIQITDLVDNSMSHKIVTAIDVLGGKMEPLVRERAIQLAQKEAREATEAVTDAKRQLEEEDERERLRLARLKAEAKYKRVEVDPFDQYSRSGAAVQKSRVARMPFGKFKGKPMSELPPWYLKWVKENVTSSWIKQAAASELSRRDGKPGAPALDDINKMLMEIS